jgi:hypothetical protein
MYTRIELCLFLFDIITERLVVNITCMSTRLAII